MLCPEFSTLGFLLPLDPPLSALDASHAAEPSPLDSPRSTLASVLLAKLGSSGIFIDVSFAQILDEIPKLSFPERRELFLQVLSLEPEADDLAVCDHVAMEGFAMLEEMEAADEANA